MAIEQLVGLRSHDLAGIKTAFAMEDAHIFVLQMVANDYMWSQVRVWPLHPEVLEWYMERSEEDLPFKEWYDAKEHWRGQQPHMLGQSIDFEWYHGQYNLLAKTLSFIVWLRKEVVEKQNGSNP